MLQNDIIEPSSSPWHCAVILVKKKSGEFRFAVDYRRLNSITKPQIFPLPRLDDMLDTIGETSAQYFSVLDMASGFWQILLDQETKHKSAFITHNGLNQFKTLPFGLSNAPMSFQIVMTEVLRGLNWKHVLRYIDDVLVLSRTLDEHLEHLQDLKPSKCSFATKSVKYLGHQITRSGILVDSDKINAVRNFPTPKSLHDLRSFLELCNYYRRFVKNYSKISAPLNKLKNLQKDEKFKWTEVSERAFINLKMAMTTRPVLSYPNMQRSFILSTDASGEAISYILGHKDDAGREHAIAYGGRALRSNEKKWSISERECLAAVEGVRQYRHFLEHQHFTVVTDHAALKWLKDIRHSSGRLSRWSMLLQGFNYEIVHKPGKSHSNADTLSRTTYRDPSKTETDDEWDAGLLFDQQPEMMSIEYSPKDIPKKNKSDSVLVHVYALSDQMID